LVQDVGKKRPNTGGGKKGTTARGNPTKIKRKKKKTRKKLGGTLPPWGKGEKIPIKGGERWELVGIL